MNVTVQEGLRISGKVTINTYRSGMVDAVTPYLTKIQEYKRLLGQGAPRDIYQMRIDCLKECIEKIKATFFIGIAAEVHNLVMDSPGYGLDLIIQRLAGINTYSLNINFIELGTGTTTPNVNDTGLTAPSIRLAVSYQEDYGATDAILQAYVTDSNLPNGTYNEAGSFIDGTSTIGSGQLFNHALLSPTYTKVSGQDTTVEVDVSISNS